MNSGGPSSSLDRTAARLRCEAATPGPWESYGNAVVNPDRATVALTHRGGWAADASDYQRNADATFMAAARTDLPLALAALDEAERRIAAALVLIPKPADPSRHPAPCACCLYCALRSALTLSSPTREPQPTDSGKGGE